MLLRIKDVFKGLFLLMIFLLNSFMLFLKNTSFVSSYLCKCVEEKKTTRHQHSHVTFSTILTV